MSAPCVLCGTDSVATCPSCGTRVCNRHMVLAVNDSAYQPDETRARHLDLVHSTGTSTVFLGGEAAQAFMSGGPRCLQCRSHDARAAEEAAARLAEEAVRRLPEVEAELRSATEPAQLGRLIVTGDERIPLTAYQAAWTKLIAAETLPPTAELVTVEEVKRPFWRVARVEVARRLAWKVPDKSRWVDEASVCWDRSLAAGCNVYATEPGIVPQFKGRVRSPDSRVQAVRRLYDAEQLQRHTVNAIKQIVAASRLGSGA